MASSKKKSAEALDDILLGALKDPQHLSAKEVLFEEDLAHIMSPPSSDNTKSMPGDSGDNQTPLTADNLEDGLHVLVSEDGMKASLVVKNCPPMEVSTIKEKLQKHGVLCGLKEKSIANAANALKTGGHWKGELVVARGFEPGMDHLIDYPFLKIGKDSSGEKNVWMAGGFPIFFDEIKEILSSQSLEGAKKTDLFAKVVNPDEVIGTIKGNVESVQGYNVFGEPIGDLLTVPEAGVNVEFNKETGAYTSKTFGYLIMTEKMIMIMPPIWISPDKMKMYYINLKQAGGFCAPFPENIQKILIDHQVHSTAGMLENIEKLSTAFAAGKELPRAIKIAEGIAPIPGRDAKFKFVHDTEVKAGRLRDDNSMDMKERNLVTSVSKGTLLAEKVLLTHGIPGKTIYGTDVPALHGTDIHISKNEGVVEKAKDKTTVGFYAKIDGNVSCKSNHIAIIETLGIEGNVDYATGNIVVKTGLSIGGSVCAGFSVKAAGNTIIGGSVEVGANVFVEGDLSIKGGVIGENTKLVVIGNLEVGFIQDAEVVVKGDIVVRNYIFNGTVRSGAEITVKKESGSLGGKIIGGYVCATSGIDAPTVGSPSVRNTIVALQSDPVSLGKQQQLGKDIEYCDENIAKMLRTLQLSTFDPQLIKAMLASAVPKQKEMILKILKTLQKFIKHRTETINNKKQLELYIEQSLKKAKIRVAAEFFEGNQVEIGKFKFVAREDMGPSVFQLQEDKIIY